MKTQRNQPPLAVGQNRRRLTVFALLFVLAAFPVWAQIDRGTIQGLVKDPSGAVVPGAKVQVVRIDTNSAIELVTNGEGLFTAPNLPAAAYRVVVEKPGFGTFRREPVEVLPRAQASVDVVLQPGGVNESVTVSTEAPILDTAAVNNSAGFNDKMIEDLPLIVVGTKRDITGFLDNLPGANNTNTFIPTVNGSTTGATEAFIDGARASERIQKGSLSENGPFLEQVGEVNVVSGAFNAEYGGFGSWFTNVIIKSGTNALHGSVFDHLGNDKLNARSFFAKDRTPYRQNEGGFTLGGPVVIPHLYNGRNKTFFFGSLGLFYSRQGAAGLLATVPTPAMLSGDFSGLTAANGSQIPIFDPTTTQPDGKGGFVRQQFPGNIIPANRITQMAKIVSSYIPAPSLPGQLNNFYDHRATTWPYYNTTTPLIKIDHSISDKQKLMFSYTHQTRPRLLWGNPAPGLGPQPAWGEVQTNPLDQIYDQQDTSWKVRLSHDYIISPTLVNHITIGIDREFNIGPNGTDGQAWDTKLGITGIPQDNGAFPALTFSGGTAAPAAMGRGYDVKFYALDYTFIENLSWIRGKHSFKTGVEIDRDRINQLQLNSIQGSFNFSNAMTSQPNSSSFGSWGSSVASFLLGAVNTAGAFIPAETGLRDFRVGAFVQDEWRATPKLTISYGLRWDYNPTFSEVQNKMSSFEPYIANPGAGGRLGALAFAGQSGLPGKFFSTDWKKGFGPRFGIAYQINSKTVIRTSAGIYYQNAPEQLITTPFHAGFNSSPTFSSADGYTPLYFINAGSFPQNFQRPPSTDPSFLNGQSISYLSPNATRLPQDVNWTFSIQRELARNLSLEAVYLGRRSTHLAFAANYDYLPIDNLKYGSLLLQPINSAAASTGGFTSPYPQFVNQLGANTVYQSLRPYPQYTSVLASPGEGSGQQKFNSLQLKATKRLSGGLTMFGYFTWAKSFSLATAQYPGSRFMQLDPNPAASFSFSWTYDLPLGKGKHFLNGVARPVNAVVSGWKINGFVKYNSGIPLTITAAAGNLGAIGYTQWGNAVQGVSPYITTSPGDFTPSSKYLNAAAFTTSTGFNFGNLNPNLSWVRGFWFKEENLTLGRVFALKEKVKLDFSMDFVNPFNFHRWGAPNTSLTSAAFGTVSSVSAGRTVQANAAIRF
uniref:TonB-dependent transporter Oar-like beta-barrel domain-containing protein n=1 Tax=Solibacter usitatus (strain Ellin6076) TaxID=234267 RepID=Q026L2_SOLUE